MKFVKLVGSRGIVLTSEKFGKFLQSGIVFSENYFRKMNEKENV